MDEWRVDAFGVLEGGDFGVVHAEAVYFGISLACLRRYSESVNTSRDVALGRCFSILEFWFTKEEMDSENTYRREATTGIFLHSWPIGLQERLRAERQ